jgi:Zn-dependent protease
MQQGKKQGWQVGALFGIPLFIDSSWIFVVALVTFFYGDDWRQYYPNWSPFQAWGTGLIMALLLFVSVLCHELGHSLVAQSQGTKVNSITLFLFGGIAAISEEAKTPGQAFQVAIAGPLVSLGLYGILQIITRSLIADSPSEVLTQELSRINLVLALFNLLPGLPLDGGQLLKAAIWKATGNRFRGVHWAAKVGQALGWFAVLFGLTAIFLLGSPSGAWIALLGWFVLRNAYTYDRYTDLQEALLTLEARDALTRNFRVVDANQTLRQFADNYLLASTRAPAYFAASEGRYRGLVSVDALSSIERSLWETQQVQTLVRPLPDIPTVREQTPLIEVIDRLEISQLPLITVLSPADAVAGVIDRGDTVRALAEKMNLPISEDEIRRIKEEGAYPASFQLPAIARSVMGEAAKAQAKADMESQS